MASTAARTWDIGQTDALMSYIFEALRSFKEFARSALNPRNLLSCPFLLGSSRHFEEATEKVLPSQKSLTVAPSRGFFENIFPFPAAASFFFFQNGGLSQSLANILLINLITLKKEFFLQGKKEKAT